MIYGGDQIKPQYLQVIKCWGSVAIHYTARFVKLLQ